MSVHRPERRVSAALLCAALAGSAASAGDGPLDHHLAGILDLAGPPPAVASVLAVDATGTRRMVVVGKCEGAGEAELGALARTSPLEEAFAFLPDQCLWIDIGIEQTPTSVRVERGILDALAGAYKKVVLYHTHVARKESQARYLPAYPDLMAVVLMNGRYLRDRDIDIRHRAVTPDEIYEYTFDPAEDGMAMLDAIFGTGLGAFAGENLRLRYGAAARADEYHDAVRDCMARSGETAWPEACFPMRAGDFVLERRVGAAEAWLAPKM